MDPKLLEYLKSLGVKPDALAGIGKSRPSATQQAKGMVAGPAKAAFEAGVVEPTKNVARAIWEQNPAALGLELGLAAMPLHLPSGSGRGVKALAQKLATEIAEKGGASIRFGTPSQLVLDKAEAVKLGKQRNQMAVWDFENMTEINTRSAPGVVADSAAAQAIRGLPMLNTGAKRQMLEWNEFTAEKSPFAAQGDRRFVFKTPEGQEVEVIGQRKGEDFRVSWMGTTGESVKKEGTPRFMLSGAGEAGAGHVRQIGRQLRDITGAKTISGERISGARPFETGSGLGGREAKRALTDSAYTRVLDAAFDPNVAKRHATTRANLAKERQSAAIISGDPSRGWIAQLGGKPLFDYTTLGKDIEQVAQTPLKRNLPLNAQGFAAYDEIASTAAKNLRSPENMARLDVGLRAGGDKWYYLDPIARAFKDEYGAERGQELFKQFAQTLGAGSPNSDWVKNIDRSLWAWPQVRARADMLRQKLPEGLGSMSQKTHLQGFQNVVEGTPITKEPYKVAGFTEGLLGNFPNLAADRHLLRQTGTPEAAKGVGYAAVEDAVRDFAAEQGGRIPVPSGRDPTAPTQAAMWIGDALAGRVQSPPNPALFDIEQAIRRMAQQSGLTPNEALKRFIIQGNPFMR